MVNSEESDGGRENMIHDISSNDEIDEGSIIESKISPEEERGFVKLSEAEGEIEFLELVALKYSNGNPWVYRAFYVASLFDRILPVIRKGGLVNILHLHFKKQAIKRKGK